MKLHHIGIVVMDCKEASENIKSFLSFEHVGELEYVPSQQATIQLLKAGGVYLEFISPDSIDSRVFKYAQKGGGFHHLCFEVKNVEKTFEEMVKKGAKPIVKPVIGFEERMTAFVFFSINNFNCNLIELAEEKQIKG